MLCVGNVRNTFLHDAALGLNALARTVSSSEGLQHVTVVELPRMRPRSPVVAILRPGRGSDVHTFGGSSLVLGMRYVDAVRRVTGNHVAPITRC